MRTTCQMIGIGPLITKNPHIRRVRSLVSSIWFLGPNEKLKEMWRRVGGGVSINTCDILDANEETRPLFDHELNLSTS